MPKKIIINVDNLAKDYKTHMNLIDLSIKYGCDKRTIKKILVDNNIYVDPYKMDVSDAEIINILSEYEQGSPIYKIAENYGIGHRRVVQILKNTNTKNRGNKKYSFDRRIFEVIDSEQKAYWLGFIYADGNVFTSKDNKSNHITIKLSNKDKSHLELFKSNFNLPHEIKLRTNKSFGKLFTSAQIRITSKDMVNDLILQGCLPNKTFTLRFPNIHSNLIHHFMRGYFDGDGSISWGGAGQKQWSVIGNQSFLQKYQWYLMEYEKINKIKIGRKKKIYYLSYGGNENVRKIGRYLYNNATIFLMRKKQHFDEIST